MSDLALPAAIVVGGAIYVLQTQAPPGQLPPSQLPPGAGQYDPTGIAMRLQSTADTDAARKVDALLQAGYGVFSTMSDAAKAAAAQKMNSQLGTHMTGNETWQQVASIAGGAVGTVACNAIPGIGTVASPLCAIAGSYLGVTLESWMESNMDDIKRWINQNVPNAVGNIIDEIGDWLGSIF